MEDPRYPTGAIEVPVIEQERRKRHIDLITPNHPLLLTVLRCLEYHERNRPSAQELCDQLATLKEDPQYTQSVQQAQGRERRGTSATADIAARMNRSQSCREAWQSVTVTSNTYRNNYRRAKHQQLPANRRTSNANYNCRLTNRSQRNFIIRSETSTKTSQPKTNRFNSFERD